MRGKGYWENCNSMDVFYECLAVKHVGERYMKVKFITWNKNVHGVAFPLFYHPMNGKIYKKDYHNWRRYEPSNLL